MAHGILREKKLLQDRQSWEKSAALLTIFQINFNQINFLTMNFEIKHRV